MSLIHRGKKEHFDALTELNVSLDKINWEDLGYVKHYNPANQHLALWHNMSLLFVFFGLCIIV